MANHGGGHGHAQGPQPSVGHMAPWQILLAVCLVLMVLTWITVTATYIDLGEYNLWLAMIIATIKAVLVCLYFMHLRWDRPFNSMVLVISLLMLMLFLTFAMADTSAYKPEIDWKPAAFYQRS